MHNLFKGIRIIDFGWAWAIPLTTKVFSDYGAEVIRVESNSKPDLWRTHPPFKDNVAGVNRNGIFIREIEEIVGKRIHYHDQYMSWSCFDTSFVKACPTVATPADEARVAEELRKIGRAHV